MNSLNHYFFCCFTIFVAIIFNIERTTAQPSDAHNITGMCLGFVHSCVVLDQRTVKCAGSKQSIGIGNSGTIGSIIYELGDNLPVIDVGIGDKLITKVTCGSAHSCILFDSQEAKCYGVNGNGQIGIGTSTNIIGSTTNYFGDALPSVKIGNGLKIKDMVSGRFHNCVLITNNKVKCFGYNGSGMLGYGHTADIGADLTKLGDFLPFVDFGVNVEIEIIYTGSGAFHTCAGLLKPVEYEKRIKCWGNGSSYRLGYGNQANVGEKPGEMGDNLPFVDLGSESRVIQMSLGNSQVCAMLVNGIVKCWAGNVFGDGSNNDSADKGVMGDALSPVYIDQGRSIEYFAAGSSHYCFVYEDRITAKCIGKNGSGQLGQGNTNSYGGGSNLTMPFMSPIDFETTNLNISSVLATQDSTCVVFSDSSVRCFGKNDYGQFANGGEQNIGVMRNQMGANLKTSMYFGAIVNMPTTASLKPTQSPVKQSETFTLSPAKAPSSLQPWEISLIVIVPVMVIGLLSVCLFGWWINCRERKMKSYRDLLPTDGNKFNFIYLTFAGDTNNQDEVAKQVQTSISKRSKSEDPREDVIGPTLKGIDDVERCLRESDNYILVLSNEYFGNARDLVELFMAIKLGLRIFFIYPTGSNFYENKAKELLNDLSEGDQRQARLSSDIEKYGCDPKEVGETLRIQIPNAMTIRCDMDKTVINEKKGDLDLLISYLACATNMGKNPKAICKSSSEKSSPNEYHHPRQHGLELKILDDIIENIKEKSRQSELLKDSIISPEGWQITIE